MSHPVTDNLSQRIFNIRHPDEFNELALEIFYFQYKQNPVYRNYCDLIRTRVSEISTYQEIPCLPVEFFKMHRIAASAEEPEHEFHSSGTTSGSTSAHLVFNLMLYRKSILACFRLFYGDPAEYCFIALIPTRKERPNSSLAFMADLLIRESKCRQSGFYLGKESELQEVIKSVRGRKLFIFGLSYALADLAEKKLFSAPAAVVMETGGMKGRREELTREALHALIGRGFEITAVHSEYSMCELFSQAYSPGNGIFSCPPWMKVLVRDMHDPFTRTGAGVTGGLNIIDLANIYTCSFIATQDAGKAFDDGTFQVLGRFDNSDLRGCSLMLD